MRVLIPLFVWFFLVLPIRGTEAAESHADPHWTYEEQAQWPLLMDRLYSPPYPYAECGIGQKQSPIDIESRDVEQTRDLDDLKTEYVDVPTSVTNNGHTIRVNTPRSHLFIGRNKYELVQMHLHAPGEHRINGKSFPMEAHFVNGTVDGRLAVLAVMFQAGKFNPEFQKILDVSPVDIGGTIDKKEVIKLARLLPANKQRYYTYSGSLTTPPCSEGVQWFLFKDPVSVSASQLDEFTSRFYHDNARIEQPHNGRKVDGH